MFQTLDLFTLSGDMARHAALRQTVVAQNIANADTPGYQARAIPAFGDLVSAPAMRSARAGHLSAATAPVSRLAEPSPNGNSVSLELEMINAVEAQREHSRALSIYRHSMSVIRSVIGGR